MALAHTILSLLTYETASGYDISKKFSRTYGVIWQASHQQVYRELNNLEKQGDITFSLAYQQGKPDRKIYRITQQGRENLKQWLATTSLADTIWRDEFLSRLLAAQKEQPDRLIATILERIAYHQKNIANLTALMQELELQQRTDYDNLLLLYIKKHLRQEQLNLEWTEQDLLPFFQHR